MSPCILAHAGNANTAVRAMTVNHRSTFDAGFDLPPASAKAALQSRGFGTIARPVACLNKPPMALCQRADET